MISVKLQSIILLSSLALSFLLMTSVLNTYPVESMAPKSGVIGNVYVKYQGQHWGWAWATVHFINEEGEEFTAYSNYRGIYWMYLPSGDYTAYATFAWYECNQTEVHIEGGKNTINFFIILSTTFGNESYDDPPYS